MDVEEEIKIAKMETKKSFWITIRILSTILVLVLSGVSAALLVTGIKESSDIHLYLLTFAGYVLLLTVMTSLLRAYERRRLRKFESIKNSLIHAFTDALDKSELNPNANSIQNKES